MSEKVNIVFPGKVQHPSSQVSVCSLLLTILTKQHPHMYYTCKQHTHASSKQPVSLLSEQNLFKDDEAKLLVFFFSLQNISIVTSKVTSFLVCLKNRFATVSSKKNLRLIVLLIMYAVSEHSVSRSCSCIYELEKGKKADTWIKRRAARLNVQVYII